MAATAAEAQQVVTAHIRSSVVGVTQTKLNFGVADLTGGAHQESPTLGW